MVYKDVVWDLKKISKSEKTEVLGRFFKCGKGEYGEGDKFLGAAVPQQRAIAKKYFPEATFEDVQRLLESKWHEHRLTGLFLLVYKYERARPEEQKKIYRFYLKNIHAVNNWDLVDTTAPNIMGRYLWEHPAERSILDTFAASKNLWKRRVAILATLAFIKHGHFHETIFLAEKLLNDKHDLIHKAVGWMLREVGKRDEKVLTSFLDTHVRVMPRTMLRYAIERLSKKQKEKYMTS